MHENTSGITVSVETGSVAEQPTPEYHWGEPIPDERALELEGLRQRWEAEGSVHRRRSPFDEIRLSGADVFFLAVTTLAPALANDEDADMTRLAMQQQLSAAPAQTVSRYSLHLGALHLEGADLTGAHLEHAFLSGVHLEMASLSQAHLEGCTLAGAFLQDATLIGVYMQGSALAGAQLQNAVLDEANLQHAYLANASLEGASLARAKMQYANLHRARLVGASLDGVHLEHASLVETDLEDTSLFEAHLSGASFRRAQLKYAYLVEADLTGASLTQANLQDVHLDRAHLQGAFLPEADLRIAYLIGTDLGQAHLERCSMEGTILIRAHLEGAFLSASSFDKASRLNDAVLSGASFDQVSFDNTNLTVADWRLVNLLGEECAARSPRDATGNPKPGERRIREFAAAVRANRVLAVALEAQGMTEQSSRFSYRAQLLQQEILWRERKVGAYLFSRFLDAIAGFGYKPVRGLVAYLCVLTAFTIAYVVETQGLLTFGLPPSSLQPLKWYEALVLSISSFHGRGFFQPLHSLGDPVAILAAAEAILGLLIEISFIATFTRRFFGSK